jgi:hypothetical protein
LKTLEEVSKNKKVDAVLSKGKNHPESKKHSISMLLITPIQRLPRYKLLLSELIKSTWPDHQDYENLGNALSQIKEIAKYVNDRKKEYENRAKVQDIQDSIINPKEAPV